VSWGVSTWRQARSDSSTRWPLVPLTSSEPVSTVCCAHYHWVGDELTLAEFTKQVKEGAKAGAAAEAPTPDTSPGRQGTDSGTRTGTVSRTTTSSATIDAALARVAALVDGSAGTLKRLFNRGGVNGASALSPEEISGALVAQSFHPRDVRFLLAELRVWEGYPKKIKFTQFRGLLRPRWDHVEEQRTQSLGFR